MSLPAWLRDAVEGWKPRAPNYDADLERGQVVACETRRDDDDRSRLVLVLEADPGEPVATVCLVSNEVDLAIDSDIIAPAEVTGLALDLVVESNLVGTVWLSQLEPSRSLGTLAPDVLDAVAAAQALEPSASGARGLPITGKADPRRAFREEELRDLKRLTGDCEQWMLDGRVGPAIPDHGPLLRRIRSDAQAAHAWLLDASEAFRNGTLEATPSLVTALVGAVSQMGPDPALSALLNSVTNMVLCALSSKPPGTVTVDLPPEVRSSHPDPIGLQAILSDVFSSGRNIVVLATEGQVAGARHRSVEVRAERKRCFVNCVDKRLGAPA